ncbi:hypothetical protein [Nocardia vaccinii]|uniref:hypothetical protein n=1 Tax=Nocardia vaccinii TaxID=1822 RepID=UPI000830D70D|nr:hypothetical protein [Nocardia vaccinii]
MGSCEYFDVVQGVFGTISVGDNSRAELTEIEFVITDPINERFKLAGIKIKSDLNAIQVRRNSGSKRVPTSERPVDLHTFPLGAASAQRLLKRIELLIRKYQHLLRRKRSSSIGIRRS